MTRAALGGLALVCLALVGWTAGLAGLAYLPFWIAAAAPGLTLGLRVFGRHAAGWVAGAAAGYATTCLVTWAVIAAGIASPFAFAAAWLVECAVLHAASRAIRAPAVALRPWTAQDTVALSAVLLLVPGPHGCAVQEPGRRGRRWPDVLSRLLHGRLRVAHGADLGARTVRDAAAQPVHGASRAELLLDVLPRAGRRHLRRACGGAERRGRAQGQRECTALLLLASIFLFAWTAGGSGLATALGVILVVLASSAEGFAAAWDLWTRGRPLGSTARHQRRCHHRVVVQRPRNRRRPPHDVLHAAARAVVHPRAARSACERLARRTRGDGVRSPRLGCSSVSPQRSTRSSAPPSPVIYGLAVVADAAVTRAPLRAIVSHWPAAIPPALAIVVGRGERDGRRRGAGAHGRVGGVCAQRAARDVVARAGAGAPARRSPDSSRIVGSRPAGTGRAASASRQRCSCSTSSCCRNARGWGSGRDRSCSRC